jgi:hypothetical protein
LAWVSERWPSQTTVVGDRWVGGYNACMYESETL